MKRRRSAWQLVFRRRLYPFHSGVSRGFFEGQGAWIEYLDSEAIVNLFVVSAPPNANEQISAVDLRPQVERIQQQVEEALGCYEDCIKWAMRKRDEDLAALPTDQLASVFLEIASWHRKIGQSIAIDQYLLEPFLVEELRKCKSSTSKTRNGHRLSVLLSMVCQDIEPTFSQTGDLKLWRLAARLQSDVSVSRTARSALDRAFATTAEIDPPPGDYGHMLDDIYAGFIEEIYRDNEIRGMVSGYVREFGASLVDYGDTRLIWKDPFSGSLEEPSGDMENGMKWSAKDTIAYDVYEELAHRCLYDNPRMQAGLSELDMMRLEGVRKHYINDIAGFKVGSPGMLISELIANMAHARLLRRETITRIDAYLAGALFSAAQHLRLLGGQGEPSRDLYFLTPYQISQFLLQKAGNVRDAIDSAKSGTLVINEDGDEKDYLGPEAKEKWEQLVKRGEIEALPSKDKLFGTIRHWPIRKSVAGGTVRVVIDHIDAREVEFGDAVVCLMVHPSHVRYLRGASLVVTEQGTLTSHVLTLYRRFVSSGLRAPIITDSPYITDVVKNDDLLQVDASRQTNGQVKLEVQ